MLNYGLCGRCADESATYRARAAELGLDGRIAFPGWLDEAVGELLADGHVLVLPLAREEPSQLWAAGG